MKTRKEVEAEARETIQIIFGEVIRSSEKLLWKKALDSITQHIKKIEFQPELSTADVHNLWNWNCVKRLMLNRYKKKFITPKFKCPNK